MKIVKILNYPLRLVVVASKEFRGINELMRQHGCTINVNFSNYNAVTISDARAKIAKEEYNAVWVAFDTNELSHMEIAHEIIHVKNYIFEYIGQKLDIHNDEVEAYLVGWLAEVIYGYFDEQNIEI